MEKLNSVVICNRNAKLAVFEADYTLLMGVENPIDAAFNKATVRFCSTPTLARREAKRLAMEIRARVLLSSGILDFTTPGIDKPYSVITSNMQLKRGRKKRK